MAEQSRWGLYELFFGFVAGSFAGFLASAYISAQRAETQIIRQENPSITSVIDAGKKIERRTRDYFLDDAEKFLMYGYPADAQKNIERFLTLNPTDEERLKALKFLDRIATQYRESNRPEQCAKIYEKVSELAPGKADAILDQKNVEFAKSYGKTEEPR